MDNRKNALQNALYRLTDREAFYGNLLQQLTICYTDEVPTAGIGFNKKLDTFEVALNEQYFLSLTNAERQAVLQHEILHFTNKHLFRLPFMDAAVSANDKMLYNIAGDMAINQYIKDLPKGAVNIKDWKKDDGSGFCTFQAMEYYYNIIKQEKEKQQENGDGKGKNGGKGNVPDQIGKYAPMDVHNFDQLDEETKKKMLEEAAKIIQRTMEKTNTSYEKLDASIKDLLKEIETLASGINYKAVLKSVIKRTVSTCDREGTWKKPNKRYGTYAPGTKLGALPKLNMYGDTSGSMSHKEINEFLNILCGFLRTGVRTCYLGLWNTDLYYMEKYKLHQELPKEAIESGGTDVNAVMTHIHKTKPDLAIVFTDGYFSIPEVDTNTEILWIISRGGAKQRVRDAKNDKIIFLDDIA